MVKGLAGKAASKAGKPFSSIFDAIKNYITSILVGFIAIKLLPLLPKMLELLKVCLLYTSDAADE